MDSRIFHTLSPYEGIASKRIKELRSLWRMFVGFEKLNYSVSQHSAISGYCLILEAFYITAIHKGYDTTFIHANGIDLDKINISSYAIVCVSV